VELTIRPRGKEKRGERDRREMTIAPWLLGGGVNESFSCKGQIIFNGKGKGELHRPAQNRGKNQEGIREGSIQIVVLPAV